MTSTPEAIEARVSERKFSDKPVDRAALERLLELAQRAPSGFNLQPWQFLAVFGEEKRKGLVPICMDQVQVQEAPCVVVFIADPLAWREHYDRVLALGEENGSIDTDRKKRYRSLANFLFRTEPLGLFGLVKRVIVPLRRMFVPTPRVISSNEQRLAYMRSHCMLCAASFMIAAAAEGLATCPMEGFDEGRLKRFLNIPGRMTVPVVIPVGYSEGTESAKRTVRLPLSEVLHIDTYG